MVLHILGGHCVTDKEGNVVSSGMSVLDNPASKKLAQIIELGDFPELTEDFKREHEGKEHKVYVGHSIAQDGFSHLTRYVDKDGETINNELGDDDFPSFKIDFKAKDSKDMFTKVSDGKVKNTLWGVLFENKKVILKPIYYNIKYLGEGAFKVIKLNGEEGIFVLGAMKEEDIIFNRKTDEPQNLQQGLENLHNVLSESMEHIDPEVLEDIEKKATASADRIKRAFGD